MFFPKTETYQDSDNFQTNFETYVRYDTFGLIHRQYSSNQNSCSYLILGFRSGLHPWGAARTLAQLKLLGRRTQDGTYSWEGLLRLMTSHHIWRVISKINAISSIKPYFFLKGSSVIYFCIESHCQSLSLSSSFTVLTAYSAMPPCLHTAMSSECPKRRLYTRTSRTPLLELLQLGDAYVAGLRLTRLKTTAESD